MTVTLAQLLGNRRSLTIPFDGGAELHVDYFPQRLTGEMLAAFILASTLDASAGTLEPERILAAVTSPTEALVTLLASWDLAAAEDEPPLPLDRATISGLGLMVQWTILGALIKDSSAPGEVVAPEALQNGRHSGATSSPRAR